MNIVRLLCLSFLLTVSIACYSETLIGRVVRVTTVQGLALSYKGSSLFLVS
jgi:hypothetical protein